MRKLRLILTLVISSAAFAACSSSITAPDDCDPDVMDCAPGWPGSDS